MIIFEFEINILYNNELTRDRCTMTECDLSDKIKKIITRVVVIE